MIGAWRGRAPRHWAADIMDGRATIDDVPAMYRDLVNTHIDISREHLAHADQNVAFWIRHITSGHNLDERRRRLSKCPESIKEEVKKGAREAWQNKKAQLPDERLNIYGL